MVARRNVLVIYRLLGSHLQSPRLPRQAATAAFPSSVRRG